MMSLFVQPGQKVTTPRSPASHGAWSSVNFAVGITFVSSLSGVGAGAFMNGVDALREKPARSAGTAVAKEGATK